MLYALVALDITIVDRDWARRKKKLATLERIRANLCQDILVAEERIPLKNLHDFFTVHEEYARLSLQSPNARTYKDALPWELVDAYRRTFANQKLAETGFGQERAEEYADKAVKVAEDAGLIALPRACGDAAHIAAYAMLKCEELYGKQCFWGSLLTPIQQGFANKYPLQDFQFWVMYGSWSRCRHCGSMYFDDKYFREQVYCN